MKQTLCYGDKLFPEVLADGDEAGEEEEEDEQ